MVRSIGEHNAGQLVTERKIAESYVNALLIPGRQQPRSLSGFFWIIASIPPNFSPSEYIPQFFFVFIEIVRETLFFFWIIRGVKFHSKLTSFSLSEYIPRPFSGSSCLRSGPQILSDLENLSIRELKRIKKDSIETFYSLLKIDYIKSRNRSLVGLFFVVAVVWNLNMVLPPPLHLGPVPSHPLSLSHLTSNWSKVYTSMSKVALFSTNYYYYYYTHLPPVLLFLLT